MGNPAPWNTIPELVADAAARFGDREGLVDGDIRWTFAQLAGQVKTAARAGIAHGIDPGDRVAIWAPNIGEWVVAALAAHATGAAVVPINTRFKGAEAGYVLQKSGAASLFCVNGFLGHDYLGMLDAAGVALPKTIVVLRGEAPDGTITWADFLAAAGDTPEGEAEARASSVQPTDLSDVIFTSGTTGRPKGVMTTHAQTLRTFDTWSTIVGLEEGDRYLIVNPFFHTFGYKAGFLACLMKGATIVPHAVFDVDQVLERIGAERISMVPGPPTLFQSILDHGDRSRFDLSSLRLAVTGAAVVPVRMIERMRQELTFSTILTAYGLTESTGVVSMCRPEDDAETIATTSGRAIPDVEVRVVDDSNEPVPSGEPGEIVVRGYNVMAGYLDDPEGTAVAIDAGGWLHTGDVGVMDERGYLRITDRKKDMFIVGGFNAYPAEIEGALLRHPSVAQVAVVGIPDDRLGEVPAAFVVPRDAGAFDPDELIAWARDEMANYKVPRKVIVTDGLPLNASGKVLKFALRQQAARSGA